MKTLDVVGGPWFNGLAGWEAGNPNVPMDAERLSKMGKDELLVWVSLVPSKYDRVAAFRAASRREYARWKAAGRRDGGECLGSWWADRGYGSCSRALEDLGERGAEFHLTPGAQRALSRGFAASRG